MIRALVPPMLVCTTLRTERPAMPVVSVPGSAAAGEVDQAPTHVPVEAGAASPRGKRPPASGVRSFAPPSADTPAYMAAEIATIRVTIAASRARCLVGGAPRPRHDPGSCCAVLLGRGSPRLRWDEPMMRHGRRKRPYDPRAFPLPDRRRELVFRSRSRSGRDNVCGTDQRTVEWMERTKSELPDGPGDIGEGAGAGGAAGEGRPAAGTGRTVRDRAMTSFSPADEGEAPRRAPHEAHRHGPAAVRRRGLRPGRMGRPPGRGRLGGLCRRRRRGGHGRRARRLVRGHRPLPPPARHPHPAHRDHPQEEGPAGRLAGRVRRRELPLRGRRTAAAARRRHRQPARCLARRARTRRPGDGGAVRRPARCPHRAAGLRRAGGGGGGDHTPRRRAGDRPRHRQTAGPDRRRRRPQARRRPDRLPRPRLADPARRLRHGRRTGWGARMDAPVRGQAGRRARLQGAAALRHRDARHARTPRTRRPGPLPHRLRLRPPVRHGHPRARGAAEDRGAGPRRGPGPHRVRLDGRTLHDRLGGGGRAQRTAYAGTGLAAVAGGADGLRPQGAGQGRRVGRGRRGVRRHHLPQGDHLPDHRHGGELGRRAHHEEDRGEHRPRPAVHPHQRHGGRLAGRAADLHGLPHAGGRRAGPALPARRVRRACPSRSGGRVPPGSGHTGGVRSTEREP